jgi:phosphate transport system permease protein
MNSDPTTVQGGSAAVSANDLTAGIRRRKRTDFAFAVLGAALVAASLMVLVLLFGQLVRDGFARLGSGHLVQANGYAPAIRDLMGTLEHAGNDPAAGWSIQRETYAISNVVAIASESELKALQDRHVSISGDIPAPGKREMEASAIKLAESATPEAYSRDAVHGKLIRIGSTWVVDPTPLPLDMSGVEKDISGLNGSHVAVSVGLSRSVPLRARSVEPLEFQGFFSSMPSREAERAGIKSALVGSVLVVFVTMILAVPLGVAAGIWLEEYGRKNWFTALVEINIANLAGVPSIVWGLMALGLLVYYLGFGRSIMTAGITLGLLVLPIVIISTREAIRSIPNHIREASYACGAGKWQTVRYHILPYSMSGILTGSIIGLSRAIGETAPLITIGALAYIAYLPGFSWSNPFGWLTSGFTVLPIQMFNWISRPDKAFHENAAAAGMVLLVLTLCLNAVAIMLRYRLRKNIKW